ncbi:MAG: ABC transporter, partial [Ramlibacter sp.]|nr:ABC transporter [Ramlibacter sp.]
RALLRAVCDEFWLVGRGGVTPFDGDLDDYQQYLLDEAKARRETVREESARQQAPQIAAEEVRKQEVQQRTQDVSRAKNLRREIEQLDQRMAKLQPEKSQLEMKLADKLPPKDIADAGKRLKSVNDELAKLEEKWIALSEALEAAS